MSDVDSVKPKGFKFCYTCDTCFLRVTVNNTNMLLPNHVGEGDGTVYIHGFDDGDPIHLPDKNQTHLLMVAGEFGDDTSISLGLRYCDTDRGSPDFVIIAKQFHIYEVKDSRDFVIKVTCPECVKSLVASGQGHLEFKGFTVDKEAT